MSIKLKSFCSDGIKSLSLIDKLEILAAANPIIMLLAKVNFGNDKSSHNICKMSDQRYTTVYIDGYWFNLDSESALTKLQKTKMDDLKRICTELKHYVTLPEQLLLITHILNGGKPIRDYDYKPSDILKKGVTIASIKKDLRKKSEFVMEN